jgi:NitT/TauT family transport system substrate-binding protein
MLHRAIAALAILILASAGSAPAQTPAALTTIRLISSPSDDLRPILYAQQAGLFARAGLTVTIERSRSGALAAQAILAGSMDIGKSSLSSLIAAYSRGIPFVLIAPSAIHRAADPNAGVLVAAASPIRSPLELQGKIVACTAIGDIGYLGLRAMIDARGGDSSTVKWVEIPTSTVAAAIEQGRVDAGLTTEPFMTKDLKGGKVRYLVDMLSGYPHPILESAFYTTRDYVAKNRETVARFTRVVLQAAAYSNTHEAETVALYATFAGLTPDTAAQMHRTFTATTFDAQQVQPVIDFAAKYGIIPKTIDARDMISESTAR